MGIGFHPCHGRISSSLWKQGSNSHCGCKASILTVKNILIVRTKLLSPILRGINHILPSYGNTTPVVWKYDSCGMEIWLLWYGNDSHGMGMTPVVWEYDSHSMGMTPISYGSKTHPFTNEQRGSHHRQGVNTFETEVKDCLLFPLLKRSKAPKGHPGII